MELPFLIYIISILPNVAGLAVGIAFCFTLAFLALCVHIQTDLEPRHYDGEDTVKAKTEKAKKATGYMKKFFFAGVAAMVFATAIPSEKQLYAIAGAYVAVKVAETPAFGRLAEKSIKVIEGKLDQYIEEMSKTK